MLGKYFSSENSFFQTAPEASLFPVHNQEPSPSLPAPASFVRPKFVQSFNVENDPDGRGVYGTGSRTSQAETRGGQKNKQRVAWGLVPNDNLLSRCKPDLTGQMPAVCLASGVVAAAPAGSVTGVDGVVVPATGIDRGAASALRFAMCDSLSLEMADGMIEARAQFWGLADVPFVGSVAANSAPPTAVAPFLWTDVRNIYVWGVDVRDLVNRVELTASFNLRWGTFRPDYRNGSPWSCTPYSILQGNATYSATLQFETPDALAWLLAQTASAPPDAFGVTIQNNADERLVFGAQNGTRAPATREATVSNSLKSSLSLVLRSLTFSDPVTSSGPSSPYLSAPVIIVEAPTPLIPN